jgi:hypothetical protein
MEGGKRERDRERERERERARERERRERETDEREGERERERANQFKSIVSYPLLHKCSCLARSCQPWQSSLTVVTYHKRVNSGALSRTLDLEISLGLSLCTCLCPTVGDTEGHSRDVT